MADKIRVLLSEEEVNKTNQRSCRTDHQGLSGERNSPDLHFKGRSIFHL